MFPRGRVPALKDNDMPAAKKTASKSIKRTARKPAKRAAKRTLSVSHKQALAQGRTLSATVDRYLAAVNTPGRRGRKVSKASLEQKLADSATAAANCSRRRPRAGGSRGPRRAGEACSGELECRC